MLVLSRKDGESILIPSQEIVIKVLEIRGNKVRIGISAPADTAVYRQEVWENINSRESNEQAKP